MGLIYGGESAFFLEYEKFKFIKMTIEFKTVAGPIH